MKVNKNTIIVPWDFTEKAEDALAHAVRIAKIMDNNIQLLNVVDSPKEVVEAKAKLDNDADKLLKDTGLEFSTIVLEGSIFSKISEYASINNVNMVIMGTHGIKGMQRITGSWALKVLAGSKVPFLVVQDKPNNEERFSDIVFPIDFTSETKEKVKWAIYLGKYFKSRIHVYKQPITDQSLSQKVNVNLNFAIRFLEQNEIDYDLKTAEKSSSFAKDTLKYAQDINADLIIIMTKKNLNLSDYILGAQEQYIITNSAKIPVMCINPINSVAGISFN